MRGFKIKERWQGIRTTISRFPLTVFFLITASLTSFISTNTNENDLLGRLFTSLLFGAVLGAVLQMLNERAFSVIRLRLLIMGVTILSAILFEVILNVIPNITETSVKIGVCFAILAVAFVWIPYSGLSR